MTNWPTEAMRIEARSYRKAAALTTMTAAAVADLLERADELERFATELKCSLTGPLTSRFAVLPIGASPTQPSRVEST
jgi:hypothetical protein